MVSHVFNPSAWEVETGKSEVRVVLSYLIDSKPA